MSDFDDSSTPIQDIITSAFLGAILGFTFYVLSEMTGFVDYLLLRFGLSGIGGRFGAVQFVILGVVLGIVVDLIGKLTPSRRA